MNEKTIDKYKIDFHLILNGCEPFSQIYSEIKKFAESMKEKNLISKFMITFEWIIWKT